MNSLFKNAAAFSLVGAVLSYIGLMHAPSLAIGAAPDFALGYVIMALFFVYYMLTYKQEASKDLPSQEQVKKVS